MVWALLISSCNAMIASKQYRNLLRVQYTVNMYIDIDVPVLLSGVHTGKTLSNYAFLLTHMSPSCSTSTYNRACILYIQTHIRQYINARTYYCILYEYTSCWSVWVYESGIDRVTTAVSRGVHWSHHNSCQQGVLDIFRIRGPHHGRKEAGQGCRGRSLKPMTPSSTAVVVRRDRGTETTAQWINDKCFLQL
jgi:hypothetical protein